MWRVNDVAQRQPNMVIVVGRYVKTHLKNTFQHFFSESLPGWCVGNTFPESHDNHVICIFGGQVEVVQNRNDTKVSTVE